MKNARLHTRYTHLSVASRYAFMFRLTAKNRKFNITPTSGIKNKTVTIGL
jgi:hypothetical protein